MVSTVERIMARRQIDALILSDPVSLEFERQEKVSTPGGGWRWGAEVKLEPQQVALIPFKRRMTEFLVDTQYGEIPDLPYVLLGRYNLNVEEKDSFWFQGEQFVVQTIDLKREIRTAAHVDYFGKPNTIGS